MPFLKCPDGQSSKYSVLMMFGALPRALASGELLLALKTVILGEYLKSESFRMPLSENKRKMQSAMSRCLETLLHLMQTAWFRIRSSLSVKRNNVLWEQTVQKPLECNQIYLGLRYLR